MDPAFVFSSRKISVPLLDCVISSGLSTASPYLSVFFHRLSFSSGLCQSVNFDRHVPSNIFSLINK